MKNLRALRESRHLSQEMLAEHLDIAPRRISAYEREVSEANISLQIKIADYFGVTLDYLNGREIDTFNRVDNTDLCVKEFGNRIRQIRTDKKLSAKEVAEKAGVSANYLLLIESGAKIPKLETAINILNTLNASADAALMDSLQAGYSVRAHFLDLKIAALAPKEQKLILDLIEVMVDNIRKNQ